MNAEMPIMVIPEQGRIDREKLRVPMAPFLPHEQQAQRNHSQTLARLAERGGLSACEAVAILEDRPWRSMPFSAALIRLIALVVPTPPAAPSAPKAPLNERVQNLLRQLPSAPKGEQ